MPPKRRRHSPGPGALGDIPKEVHMITAKQYTDTYNRWTESLRKSSEMLTASSECRKVLIKNIDSADPLNLLQEAVNCIYDLTGDRCFLKEVTEGIERRRKDNR
jgi:hypothetical protein